RHPQDAVGRREGRRRGDRPALGHPARGLLRPPPHRRRARLDVPGRPRGAAPGPGPGARLGLTGGLPRRTAYHRRMALRPRLQGRLFALLTTLGDAALFRAGRKSGNDRVAVLGALFFLGYGLLHSVTRRLTPAARMLSGSEADRAERLAQFRATRTAGQVALGIAALGVVLDLAMGWPPALWVSGTALVVVGSFVAALWFYGKNV